MNGGTLQQKAEVQGQKCDPVTIGPTRTGQESHADFYGDCILSY